MIWITRFWSFSTTAPRRTWQMAARTRSKTFRANGGVPAFEKFRVKRKKKKEKKKKRKKKDLKETEEGESQANMTRSLGPVRFAVG